jgi:HSP20 family molecular chaperone IbpA
MIKKKCPSCARKIERKFNYFPHCGESLKLSNERENFGMLGRDDSFAETQNQVRLPFGMEGVVNSLMRQLEKQMNSLEKEGAVPRGFQIRISNGVPQMKQVTKKEPVKKEPVPAISEEEAERRARLKRVEAESKVKRLGDAIIYELSVPGISSKKDVVITKLEQGIEVKAYSKDRCYVKIIPLKIEIVGYSVEKDKVSVEFKG